MGRGRILVFKSTCLQPNNDPIIVKIMDPPSDIAGLADVLIGALGIAGAITVAAVLFGVVLAGVMFWIRSRQTPDEL